MHLTIIRTMKLKLIIKIMLLIFSLAAVILAMKLTSSGGFQQGLSQIFYSTDTSKTMRWCPEHVVDFKWEATDLPEQSKTKWLGATPEQIKDIFCVITMDVSDGSDLSQLQFKPMLLAQSAEAKTALLEWNSESKVFRVQGMPFKSASLSRELLDDPK